MSYIKYNQKTMPENPSVGDFWWNGYQLVVFDEYGWKDPNILTDPTIFDSYNAGYTRGGIVSGSTLTSSIVKISYSDETATINGNGLRESYRGTGYSSSSKGYERGGTDSTDTKLTEDIDTIAFSNDTTQVEELTLTTVTTYAGGSSSSTVGYVFGGMNASAYKSTISGRLFSDNSDTSVTSTLSDDKALSMVTSSSLNGYAFGGHTSSSTVSNEIEKFIYSSQNSSNLATGLRTRVTGGATINSSLKGYYFGGSTSVGSDCHQIAMLIHFKNADETASYNLMSILPSGIGHANTGGLNSSYNGYIVGGTITCSGDVVSSVYKFAFAADMSYIYDNTSNSALPSTLSRMTSFSTSNWNGLLNS